MAFVRLRCSGKRYIKRCDPVAHVDKSRTNGVAMIATIPYSWVEVDIK